MLLDLTYNLFSIIRLLQNLHISFAILNYKHLDANVRGFLLSIKKSNLTSKTINNLEKLPPNSAVVNLWLSLFLVACNIFLCYNKIKTYFLIQGYFIVIRKENLHGYIHQLFNKAME